MKKILIIRLTSLGDIIHTYPMIYDIKKNIPHSHISWLVDEDFIDVARLNPLVDEIISIGLRRTKRESKSIIKYLFNWRVTQSKVQYDYIIDAQGLLKSAILTKKFVGNSYGLDSKSIKERLATLFYRYKISTGKNILAITKNRILASKIFNYKINTDTANFLPAINSKKQTLAKQVIFFHATSKNSKKLEPEAWAELAVYLIDKFNFDIILPYGSQHELNESLYIQSLILSLNKNYVSNIKIPDSIMSYYDMANTILNSEFVFGVDTGLIHLANALNKPTIALYVDTDPKKTGIFESKIAKNIGGINYIISSSEIINLFNQIYVDSNV